MYIQQYVIGGCDAVGRDITCLHSQCDVLLSKGGDARFGFIWHSVGHVIPKSHVNKKTTVRRVATSCKHRPVCVTQCSSAEGPRWKNGRNTSLTLSHFSPRVTP